MTNRRTRRSAGRKSQGDASSHSEGHEESLQKKGEALQDSSSVVPPRRSTRSRRVAPSRSTSPTITRTQRKRGRSFQSNRDTENGITEENGEDAEQHESTIKASSNNEQMNDIMQDNHEDEIVEDAENYEFESQVHRLPPTNPGSALMTLMDAILLKERCESGQNTALEETTSLKENVSIGLQERSTGEAVGESARQSDLLSTGDCSETEPAALGTMQEPTVDFDVNNDTQEGKCLDVVSLREAKQRTSSHDVPKAKGVADQNLMTLESAFPLDGLSDLHSEGLTLSKEVDCATRVLKSAQQRSPFVPDASRSKSGESEDLCGNIFISEEVDVPCLCVTDPQQRSSLMTDDSCSVSEGLGVHQKIDGMASQVLTEPQQQSSAFGDSATIGNVADNLMIRALHFNPDGLGNLQGEIVSKSEEGDWVSSVVTEPQQQKSSHDDAPRIAKTPGEISKMDPSPDFVQPEMLLVRDEVHGASLFFMGLEKRSSSHDEDEIGEQSFETDASPLNSVGLGEHHRCENVSINEEVNCAYGSVTGGDQRGSVLDAYSTTDEVAVPNFKSDSSHSDLGERPRDDASLSEGSGGVVTGSPESYASIGVIHSRPSFNQIKARLYFIGCQAHRGHGAEKIFSNYWSSLTFFLGAKPNATNARKCREAFGEFLITRKLRRLHNILIFSLLEQTLPPQMNSLVPTPIHVRERGAASFCQTSYCMESKSISRDVVRNRFVPGLRRTDSVVRFEWKMRYSSLVEDESISSFPLQAGSSSLPGALVVDPFARDMVQRDGMRTNETTVWLLTIAVQEYAKSILTSVITAKETMDTLCNGAPLESASNASIDSPSKVLEGTVASSLGFLPTNERRQVTVVDLGCLMARHSSRKSGALNGRVSRTASERCAHSLFPFCPFKQGGGFDDVQRFISAEILAVASKRRRVGEVTTLASALPGPPIADSQHLDHSEAEAIDIKAETRIRSPVVGLGRGAKDLAALKARAEAAAKTSGVDDRDVDAIPDGSEVAGAASTKIAANQAVHPSRKVDGADLQIETPDSLTTPDASTNPENVVCMEGHATDVVAQNLASSGIETNMQSNENQVSIENSEDSTESQCDPSTTQTGRRGKGFGIKNLAAMRARTLTRESFETNVENLTTDNANQMSTEAVFDGKVVVAGVAKTSDSIDVKSPQGQDENHVVRDERTCETQQPLMLRSSHLEPIYLFGTTSNGIASSNENNENSLEPSRSSFTDFAPLPRVKQEVAITSYSQPDLAGGSSRSDNLGTSGKEERKIAGVNESTGEGETDALQSTNQRL